MNFAKKFSASEFLVNTGTLIGGTGIAQILPLIFAPLISRLFGTDDFSVYGVFVSMYAILGVLFTLRYDLAVMLPVDEKKAKDVVFLCLTNSFILMIFFFITTILLKNPIIQLFNIEHSSSKWIILVPVSAFFLSVNNVLITWHNRNKQYKIIAGNRILRNGLLTGSNIGFGFVGYGFMGLIFSQIISDAVAAVYYVFAFFRNAMNFRFKVSGRDMLVVAKQYKDFPKFTLPSTFVDTFSAQLPILLIASLYSQTLSGSYFFAYRILAIPIAIIGSAFAQTFYQKFVTSVQQNDFIACLRFLKRSWLLLGTLIIIPAIVLMFWGVPVFSLVFGSEWNESGKIASVLILYIMFAFVSSPTSSTYIALGMQKYNLIFSGSVLIYRFGTLYLGYLLGDFYLGLILLVSFEITEILIYNLIVVIRLKKRIAEKK